MQSSEISLLKDSKKNLGRSLYQAWPIYYYSYDSVRKVIKTLCVDWDLSTKYFAIR